MFCHKDIPLWDTADMEGPRGLGAAMSPLAEVNFHRHLACYLIFPLCTLFFPSLKLITSLRETLKDGTEYPTLCPNISLGLASLVVLT